MIDDLKQLEDFTLRAMQSIPSVKVALHRKRNPHIVLNDSACRWAWLRPELQDGREVLRLDMHAGDGISQAKELYRSLSLEKLLALSRQDEWTVVPSIGFSFMSTGLHSAYPLMDLESYARFWIEHAEYIKKVPRADGDFCGITDWLQEGSFINDDDIDALHALFHHSQRDHMHFFPRLSLTRRWRETAHVIYMGVQSFAHDVGVALDIARSCWNDENTP